MPTVIKRAEYDLFTGEVCASPKIRNHYNAQTYQDFEHTKDEYLVDTEGYTPMQTLIARCIREGRSPFAGFPGDVVVDQDFADNNPDAFEKAFDDYESKEDSAFENALKEPASPAPSSDVKQDTQPVNNSSVLSDNEVKA